jgi:hypothetical protein
MAFGLETWICIGRGCVVLIVLDIVVGDPYHGLMRVQYQPLFFVFLWPQYWAHLFSLIAMIFQGLNTIGRCEIVFTITMGIYVRRLAKQGGTYIRELYFYAGLLLFVVELIGAVHFIFQHPPYIRFGNFFALWKFGSDIIVLVKIVRLMPPTLRMYCNQPVRWRCIVEYVDRPNCGRPCSIQCAEATEQLCLKDHRFGLNRLYWARAQMRARKMLDREGME